MTRLLVLTALALLLPAAAAAADTNVRFNNGELSVVNEDVSVKNAMGVDYARHNGEDDIHIYDESDPNGITIYPTPPCYPGKVNAKGNPTEIFCTRSQIKALSIDLGPNEDSLSYKADQTPSSITGNIGSDTLTMAAEDDQVAGDQGNDTIDTGAGNDDIAGDDGNDTVRAGEGNDKINGGTGADTVDAGPGDDNVTTADGVADKVECGDGNDTVSADSLDELTNCESVQRQFVAAPAGQPAGDDHTPPKVEAGALTAQRVSAKRHTLKVAASSSEAGLIGVTGYLAAAGINDRLKPASAKVKVAGAGVEIKIKLSSRQVKLALKDLKHHRHPRVRLTVAATDASGNTSSVRRFWVDLVRR